jgi:mannose-6-phosphate isomerase-like protein (cupin superfamily)
MRAIAVGLTFTLLAIGALAQAPKGKKKAQEPKLYASSSDVAGMMAKAKSERKQDQATFAQRIVGLAPYNASLEYRAAVGPASVHEREAEIFYVVDGSGTLMTGGQLVKKESGAIVEGGTTQAVAKGDWFIVPENTPHWFSSINGVLVLMSLHVPRPVGDSH